MPGRASCARSSPRASRRRARHPDAHGGIKAAIAQVLSDASWQRCRTHFMANLASRVARGNWPMIATLVRSIFEQPDREATWAQLSDVVDKLTTAGFNDVAVYLIDAADDILAFSDFPTEHWPKIRSNNPQERLNKEIRRRTDVRRHLPEPPGGDPSRRRHPGRADRRVDHRQALHERRVSQVPSHPRAPGRRPAPGDGGGRRWMTRPQLRTSRPPPARRS